MKLKYPTDISDNQWLLIKPLFKNFYKRGGRPCRHQRREILNAIFYITRTGCQWRLLPNDFPPWKVVYENFSRWRDKGFLQKIHNTLRSLVRLNAGRFPSPSAGIIDSQTIKTTESGGARGYDGGKKNQRSKATYFS